MLKKDAEESVGPGSADVGGRPIVRSTAKYGRPVDLDVRSTLFSVQNELEHGAFAT